MKVGILTAPRPQGVEYLRFTTRQVLDKASSLVEVRVFVDDLELPKYRADDDPRVTYELATPEQRRLVDEGCRWGTLNFIKALRWAATDEEYACVFEDDVELARNWTTTALALCHEAKRMSKGFVFSFHHFYQMSDFRVCAVANGVNLMRWRDPRGFYGGQGLIMPAPCARKMADTLELKMQLPAKDRAAWGMDMGVKGVILENGWTLYSPHPCLLQHVGDTSSVIHGRPPIRNAFFKG